jgi:hypothetical protein
MIRRDYIIDAIEEFAEVLAKLLGFTKEADWQSASNIAAGEFQRLIGVSQSRALEMSEEELLAQLVQQGPTHLVEAKTYMLAALFKATGDVLAGRGDDEESQRCYLKGLHLLLGAAGLMPIEARPDFAPKVETFLASLRDATLSTGTRVLLMRHYEMEGDFARAENELFTIAETSPRNPALLQFGESFYQRLLTRPDSALTAGNLSRAEVESGLADFRAKMA